MPHHSYSGRTLQMGAVVYATVQPVALSAADECEQIAACRHQVFGSSGLAAPLQQ